MIVRIWRGWTRSEDTEAYATYIEETGLAAYQSTPGNQAPIWLVDPTVTEQSS